MSTIFRFILIVLGFTRILQFIGVDFGLQNITNNFVSGIIILFECPIKIGDRIEAANVTGDVVKISLRSTSIITNDNISIIVQNSEFNSSTVINWIHTDRNVRFNFPVSVSYKPDPEIVKKFF